jgi:hypothetical protein
MTSQISDQNKESARVARVAKIAWLTTQFGCQATRLWQLAQPFPLTLLKNALKSISHC